jgi:tRNA G37 N-methylase TrmD
VPQVLLSGNHARIQSWRTVAAKARTAKLERQSGQTRE